MGVAWSGDGKRIASGSFDLTVRVWDASSGKAIGKPFDHDLPVLHVDSDTEGLRIVSCCEVFGLRPGTGYGQLWDVAQGKCVMTSMDASWSTTLERFGLSSLHVELAPKASSSPPERTHTRIVERTAEGRELVLASTDTGHLYRFGDVYYSGSHCLTFWPFCRVLR